MKITREADYALRIVAMLAADNTRMDAKAIAEKNHIPYRFALKILNKLVSSGILKSFRGSSGGYLLAKSPKDITLRDIVELIDGKIAINKCLEDPTACENSGVCKVQRKLYSVQCAITGELEKISFDDVLKEKL